MKIRCDQNSIRIRVRKSELTQLRAEHWLSSNIHFPNESTFAWELSLHDGLDEMRVHFSNGRILVQLPPATAQNWMDSEEVGMECFLPVGPGTALHVLVEKDFPCKNRPDEDKADFFNELAEDAPVKC